MDRLKLPLGGDWIRGQMRGRLLPRWSGHLKHPDPDVANDLSLELRPDYLGARKKLEESDEVLGVDSKTCTTTGPAFAQFRNTGNAGTVTASIG